MNQKRNQTKVVNVFTVFMVMLILYFIVGLFTVINQQFQIPLQTAMLPHDGNITNALVTMLNFSWFLAIPYPKDSEHDGWKNTDTEKHLILPY